MTNLNELAAALINARSAKEECAAALKSINALVEECERAVFDAMVEAELPKITANGYSFSLDTKDYFTADPEQTTRLRMSLIARGLHDIFKYQANYQTLQATLRELADQNGGELPEAVRNCVTVYQKSAVSVRKAK